MMVLVSICLCSVTVGDTVGDTIISPSGRLLSSLPNEREIDHLYRTIILRASGKLNFYLLMISANKCSTLL